MLANWLVYIIRMIYVDSIQRSRCKMVRKLGNHDWDFRVMIDQTPYINTWGYYFWILKDDKDLKHADEHDANSWLPADRFMGQLVYCSGKTEDGYLILHYDQITYYARPKAYKIVLPPVFNYGDVVQDKQDSTRIGVVRHIGWHFKHRREYYHLQFGEHKSTRRYFSDELELIKNLKSASNR